MTAKAQSRKRQIYIRDFYPASLYIIGFRPIKKQIPIFAIYTISDTAGCEPHGINNFPADSEHTTSFQPYKN